MPTGRCAAMISEAGAQRLFQRQMLSRAKQIGWLTWILVIGGSLLAVYSTGPASILGLVAWAAGVLGQITLGRLLHRRDVRAT